MFGNVHECVFFWMKPLGNGFIFVHNLQAIKDTSLVFNARSLVMFVVQIVKNIWTNKCVK